MQRIFFFIPWLAKRINKDQVLRALLAVGFLSGAGGAAVHFLTAATLSPSDRGLLVLVLEISVLMMLFVRKGQEEPLLALSIRIQADKGILAMYRLRKVAPGLLTLAMCGLLLLFIGMITDPRLSHIGVFMCLISLYLVFEIALYGSKIHATTGAPAIYVWLVAMSQTVLIIFGLSVYFHASPNSTLGWFLFYALPGGLILIFVIIGWKHFGWSRVWLRESAELSNIDIAGKKLLPGLIANFLTLRMDRFLIPVFAGVSSLGVYSLVVGVLDSVLSPTRSWIESSLSRWRKNSELISFADIASRATLVLAISSSFVAAVAVVILFAMNEFLAPTYSGARDLILPASISSAFYSVFLYLRSALIASRNYSGARKFDLAMFITLGITYPAVLSVSGVVELTWSRAAVFMVFCFSILAFLAIQQQRLSQR